MEISPPMEAYFARLSASLSEARDVAARARAAGLDPRTTVEVPVTNDLADRVEALLGIRGVAARLRELEAQMGREEVALAISDDFIRKRFGEKTREEVLDHAIRTAMAVLTEGVVAAPTEGIAKVGLGKNDGGTEFLRIYYAGPIRSAGGTAQALSVLVGDYVRRALGIDRYRPRPEEVARYVEEIRAYHSRVSLQYLPGDGEIRKIVEHCPVCIDGEATEHEEVSGYRNLERVETNAIRGGMALVIAEGIALKAPKLQKHVRKLSMDGWEWLEDFGAAGKKGNQENGGIAPRDKYLRDIIAGRPVFAHPMRKGGFRLRYGRSRNSGFAAAGLNPATLEVLGRFLAVGTQMKLERPGKAAGIVPVDTIEGPTVRLKGGGIHRIDSLQEAVALADRVDRILDVGEILISFGEFLENNHPLMPAGYCREWWELEHGVPAPATGEQALEMARGGGWLHPDFSYYWEDLTPAELETLADAIAAAGSMGNGGLSLPRTGETERLLEELLVEFCVEDGRILISRPLVLLACLGLSPDLKKLPGWNDAPKAASLALASHLSGVKLRPQGGTRIGGRMGRPGKSRPREMSPPPHVLFPLGESGGSRRSFQEAASGKRMEMREGGFTEHEGIIQVDVGERKCPACGRKEFRNRCICGGPTVPVFRCSRCGRETEGDRCPRCDVPATSSQRVAVNLKEELQAALDRLGIRETAPVLVKGVRGMISREKAVEPVEKGILRAHHGLFVFKDGTIRYDMIDLPLTHFRPDEVGVPVERLRDLGYTADIHGKDLSEGSQVLELRPQDVLVSEACGDYLVKVAAFLDELLEKCYGLPPFYRVKSRDDLVGQMLVGLAPHTSAGVLGRLIGFSRANVGYAHPFFHAAKRRNCFHGDTRIDVSDGTRWVTKPIRQFVLENFDVSTPGLDRLGTYYSSPKELAYVRAVDTQGTLHLRRVTAVSVHRSPAALIRFGTARGRSLAVTPDHTMLVADLGYLRRIRAMEVKEGDCLPVYAGGAVIAERVATRELVPSPDDSVYCLTVDGEHTMEAEGIFTGQCDGDEDCVMLLLDCLINFSRAYLPENRGGTMDAPLMITSQIDPSEIDKESHNLDVGPRYPLNLYLAALGHAHPREVEAQIDRVEHRLGTPAQLEGFLFTHDTTDISAGPLESTYTALGTMQEKLEAMLTLATRIRAVDVDDVAERVLTTHFIPDLMGNLRAFSNQTVRCTRCNSKFRRVPLAGKCPRCGGSILPTIHEASVKKYLDISRQICGKYGVSPYTRQRIAVLEMAIQSTFGIAPEKQMGLADFM
ncbi:MAG: DNA-directed DNA polymerase II large subunit [Methanomicrobiales archaeon]|nr:DNA-directed DNA polymerase II large subunit [Methanomicrobiales archaeon]